MRGIKLLTLIVMTIWLTGCGDGPKSARGFSLPDGDAARGKQVFVQAQCHQCHSVSGVSLPKVESAIKTQVSIGGEVTKIRTYGELVTSIINPSHKLAPGYAEDHVSVEGQSKMSNYNDVMTVTELIDVVAFLQSRYELRPYEPSHYPMY